MDGYAERLRREQHGRAWTAWHAAALGRWGGKRLPSLELLTGEKQKVSPMSRSEEEMEANLKAWAMVLGSPA